MAKKRSKPNTYTQSSRQSQNAAATEEKSGLSLKEMLGDDALSKLKALERDMKEEKARLEQEEQERRRREQEEREKNKSFAELLDDFDKKGGGKYS
ncbi:MAG TPA: DUF3886 domain-containing protein [Candidatus Bathyarchaeia archaeon]|nr:DUF3886 domain-containing protein [Candidatus Bathyarchaeia archaeon]